MPTPSIGTTRPFVLQAEQDNVADNARVSGAVSQV